MKLKNIFFILLILGCIPSLPQRPPINVKKVLWYTAEVITPIALIISSMYLPMLSRPDMEEVDEHKIAASINSVCGIFLIGNALLHGCRGLCTELKPAIQEYIAQIKQRRLQKTS